MAFARSTILRTYNSLKGIGNLPEAKSMKDVKEIKSFVARWRNGTGDANPMDEMIPVKNQMYDTSSPLKFAVTQDGASTSCRLKLNFKCYKQFSNVN
ncbi:hypothetical protein DPMN_030702 [Dreissena polymorpha]|uniref:Uncharacterized protein n=1 Tax=Dreissena polymorpha TaxID=45954 RepID=A0A9D4RIJ4_DREPO|nr:hypothetical protein DPMN_030702 [Dreissena polymorpha]